MKQRQHRRPSPLRSGGSIFLSPDLPAASQVHRWSAGSGGLAGLRGELEHGLEGFDQIRGAARQAVKAADHGIRSDAPGPPRIKVGIVMGPPRHLRYPRASTITRRQPFNQRWIRLGSAAGSHGSGNSSESAVSTGAAGISRGSRSGGTAGPASGSAGAGEEDGIFLGNIILKRWSVVCSVKSVASSPKAET